MTDAMKYTMKYLEHHKGCPPFLKHIDWEDFYESGLNWTEWNEKKEKEKTK